jgi:hypothetical protein
MALFVVFGCSGGSAPDLFPPEHACDPNTPAGPVTVHSLQIGSFVIAHDTDGAVLSRVEVPEQNATIEVDVPGCGAITMIDSSLQLYETTLRVQPGDVLFDYPDIRFTNTGGRLIIEQPVAEAFTYNASAGSTCSNVGLVGLPNEFEFNLYPHCATSPIVVVEPRPQFGPELPLTYAIFENVNLAATEQTPLRVTSWTTDAAPHLMTIDIGQASGAGCFVASMNAGLEYPTRQYISANNGGTSHELDLRFAEFGDAASLRCQVFPRQDVLREKADFVPAPLAGSLAITEADLLPDVVDVVEDGDPVRPTVSWSVVPDLVEEDFVIANVGGVAPNGAFSLWRVVAPPGTRSVQVPDLPPDLQPAFTAPFPTVHLFESTDVPDYSVARTDTYRFFLAGFRPDAPIPRTERRTSSGRI